MFEIRPYRKNQINTWNPFAEMEEFQRRFFGGDFFSFRGLSEFRTDITDEGDCYVLKADLPGFSKEDIRLELDGDRLVIGAERRSEYEEKDKKGKFIRCERSYGAFRRSFDVSGIKTDEIKAKYKDGVLTLKMPKEKNLPDKARQIEIE